MTPAQVEFGRSCRPLSRGREGRDLATPSSLVADANALIQVVRCFSNIKSVRHLEGNVDPLRDFDMQNEMIFRDRSRYRKPAWKAESQKSSPEEETEKRLLDNAHFEYLLEEAAAGDELKPAEWRLLRVSFVTSKPEIILLNLDDSVR